MWFNSYTNVSCCFYYVVLAVYKPQMIYTISRHYNTEERVANGIKMPERAEIALMQEEKLKTFYSQLNWALAEYDRIVAEVIPVTAMILRPHFKDMEWKLRPGMTTLTWTSLNIDPYINHVHSGLKKLQELVICINDIIENSVEKNLKIVSKTLLVDLPENSSFTVSDFVIMQQSHIRGQSRLLQGKNMEIENAVSDLIIRLHPTSLSPKTKASPRRILPNYVITTTISCTKLFFVWRRIQWMSWRSVLAQERAPTFSTHPTLLRSGRAADTTLRLSITLAWWDSAMYQQVSTNYSVVLQEDCWLGLCILAQGETSHTYVLHPHHEGYLTCQGSSTSYRVHPRHSEHCCRVSRLIQTVWLAVDGW